MHIQIYADPDDNSFTLIEKGTNQFLITQTSILLKEVECAEEDIHTIYETEIKAYNETIRT